MIIYLIWRNIMNKAKVAITLDQSILNKLDELITHHSFFV
jgi:hypothetical protein